MEGGAIPKGLSPQPSIPRLRWGSSLLSRPGASDQERRGASSVFTKGWGKWRHLPSAPRSPFAHSVLPFLNPITSMVPQRREKCWVLLPSTAFLAQGVEKAAKQR